MDKISKNVALILIFSIVISSSSLPLINSAQAQNNAAPTISILYPTNNTVFNVEFAPIMFHLEYQNSSTLSWVGYSIDGTANVTITVNDTEVDKFENNGYHNLTLYANDTAGNWAKPQVVTYFTHSRGDAVPLIDTITPPFITVLVVIAIVAVAYFRGHKKNKYQNQTVQVSRARHV